MDGVTDIFAAIEKPKCRQSVLWPASNSFIHAHFHLPHENLPQAERASVPKPTL